ncbi:hypothetical protein [Undibacterium sp. RuTC16W]|uniref:hypothetical protein n=1 Tax=Undibacterium sp. RuTC16W TaxID=3413048 RepID=UPI003BEF7C3C
MESALWSINLLALVYLCFWAIRQDNAEQEAQAELAKARAVRQEEHQAQPQMPHQAEHSVE